MAEPAFDPALSAFLRSMGVAEQTIYAEARQRSDLAQRRLDRSVPEWQDRFRAATEGVLNDAESRGVYQSGASARNVALARAGVQRQQSEARALVNDEQTAYGLDAAARVAELRRQAAEQELAARTRQTETAARSVYGYNGG